MSNIVREFDTPIGEQVTTRDANVQDSKVLVEDSVEHQAGDGQTAGMSPSMETPDIFDNRPQAVIETQDNETQHTETHANQDTVVDAQPVEIITSEENIAVDRPQAVAVTADELGVMVTGENNIVPALQTLPDGSVDIPRDN